MNNLLQLLSKTDLVQRFNTHQALANLSINQEGLMIAGAFFGQPRRILLVKEDLYSAQLVYQNLLPLFNADQVLLYGAEESLRVEAVASSPERKAQRIDCLAKVLDYQNRIVVTHVGALIKYLPLVEEFRTKTVLLRVGMEYNLISLKQQFVIMGYTNEIRVSQPLVFSARGNIIDIWSADDDMPYRVEFFGDEIESIRSFDSDSQSTIESLVEILILPAQDNFFTSDQVVEISQIVNEKLLNEQNKSKEHWRLLKNSVDSDIDLMNQGLSENHLYRYRSLLDNASFLDYIKPDVVVLAGKDKIYQHYHRLIIEQVEYLQELYQVGKSLLILQQGFDLPSLLKTQDIIMVNDFYQSTNINNDINDINVPANRLNLKLKTIAGWSGKKVLVVNHHKIGEVLESLVDSKINYQMISSDDEIVDDISVIAGDINSGFYIGDSETLVISGQELFNQTISYGRFEKRFASAEMISDYNDLKMKDYIVHYQHGVGQYLGIVTKEVGETLQDYLQILYRDDAMLYVPLEQFKFVRKFVSGEGIAPKLSKLGSGEWTKAKEKITQSIQDLAERLVELYAVRQDKIGFAFSGDNAMQENFEAEFIYELTADQQRAITEIKSDMMSEKPMDRLLCGDVGFGKTEVALRAAFKAVLDNKQVAYLCPTTILSDQHFQTFLGRLENYPVKVALLNRFCSEAQQKVVLEDLKKGHIDILIGTHRILSKDVVLPELGLLIIDEEQRFGVVHKERIKEYKNAVDVLSLSATPIPRTLQMSLVGIRSLSQLNTPPVNRVSVQTYVIEKNMAVILEVIQRELARRGQVFYLYNNIDNIYSVAMGLSQKLPHAKVAIAHGQMAKEEIEDVMMRFIHKDCDVLVCTTIIETGIDIPNANTIIIDSADRFGLSQLYQIKGRVGRSAVLAYAYLMYTPSKQLSERATKRLKAIKDFAQLGSGYKIAMRDLTIRGAGDLLGPNQSGFINTVGMDLYLEILNEAIAIKRGKVVREEAVNMPKVRKINAYIPQKFTDYDLEKLNLYQDIEACNKLNKLQTLVLKTKDLFGKLPSEVELLFEKKKLELLLNDPRIENFKQANLGNEITFNKDYSSKLDGIKLFSLMNDISVDIKLKFLNQRIIVFLPNSIDWLEAAILVLTKVGV